MHKHAAVAVLACLVLACLWGCENDTSNGTGDPGVVLTDKTCLGCHSSRDMLIASLGEEAASQADPAAKDDG